MDLFGFGANRQKQQDEAEAPVYTMENNALARVIEQQRARREEEAVERARRAAEDLADMKRLLDAAGQMCAALGRPVQSWYINDGGQVIVAHRELETVRIAVGGIDSPIARKLAAIKCVTAVAGY